MSESFTESPVVIPSRRTPVPPVPLALRRDRATGRRDPLGPWLPVGTLDDGTLGRVDPAGRIRMGDRLWSLDWWIGAEDRWHHPSMEPAVRQQPLELSAVLQTSMKVPGGNIVHRAGGARIDAGAFSGPAVVVEIENLSAVPVALAVVLTPWTLDRTGHIERVSIEGASVSVDGQVAVLLDRVPSRMVQGSTADVAMALAAGDDEEPASVVSDPAGDLEVALVMPLTHSAVVRLVLPVPPSAGRRFARTRQPQPTEPWQAPQLAAVASGWLLHGRSDPRVDLPLSSWSELVGWSAHMLRLEGPEEVRRALDSDTPEPSGRPWGARLAAVTEALAGLDAEEINAAVAAALVRSQRFSGRVLLPDGSDATTAMLWAAAAVLGGRNGARYCEELLGPVAKAVRYMSRLPRGKASVGEVDGFRAAAALRRVAAAIASVGQPGVAGDALATAGLRNDVSEVSATEFELAADLREHSTGDLSSFDEAGAERDLIVAGDPDGLVRLARRLADRECRGVCDATDAMGRATGVLGFDAAELAETRCALLDVVLRDSDRGPLLLPTWPMDWAGQSVEAHDIPTAWGRTSVALRWHGERPAVLWEVVPALGSTDRTAGTAAPLLRAPGIDPDWSAVGWSGESLLAAPGDAPEVTQRR